MHSANAHKRRRQQRLLYLTGAALIASLIVLATAIALLQQQSRRASAEIERQVALNAHLRQLQVLLINLGNAETSQRGYLLTGDPEYLISYRSAASQTPALLVGLEGLESIEPGLQARAEGIKEVVVQKLAELAETIHLYETGRQADATVLVQTGVGKQAMARARQGINGIAEAIRTDRDTVAAEIARSGEERQALATAGIAALALCVLLAATQIGILLAARTRFERDLAASDSRHRQMAEEKRDSEEFLSRTGRLAGVGGWEVDLATRRVRWSEQVRRLHEADDSHVPTIESGIGFFEPAFRPRMKAALEAAERDGTPFDLELPLVTAKGRRLCARVVGEAQRNAQGTPVRLVGAMQDITERKDLEDRIRESERFVREITDNLPIAIAYVDAQGRYQFVNQVHVKRFHRPREEILGKTRAELIDAPMEGAREKMAAVLSGMAQRFIVEERHGGELRLIDGQMIPAYDEHSAIKGFYATGVDITDLKRTEMQLRELTEIETRARAELQLQTSTLNAIIESIPAMVAVFDRNLRYRLVNREFERQRALRREEVIGRNVAELFGQEEYDQRWPWVQKVLAGETVVHERTASHAGRLRDVSVTYFPLRLEDGSVDGFITVAQDITSHRDEERRLLDLSERDALTGLLNRAGFAAYLAHQAQALPESGLALLYVDLDRFKPVNDTHGHAVGDAVLQQFAQRTKALVRPTDAVARLGGDEFAVVLPGVRDHATAEGVAKKVVDAAHAAFPVKGLHIHIGASVGIALAPQDGNEIAGLMAQADERVYAAKAAGRGRAV